MTDNGREIKRLKSCTGTWANGKSVETFHEDTRSIYVSPREPSFVCWVVAWIDKEGAKIAFTEIVGDPAIEPTYSFHDSPLDCYTKTLISTDKGKTWRDTGWKEKLCNLKFNSDHHWRSVAVKNDGTLVRMMPHIPPDLEDPNIKYMVFAPHMAGSDRHPFIRTLDLYRQVKFPAAWQSKDGGATWQQVCFLRSNGRWWPSDVIYLRDGQLLAIGRLKPEGEPCPFNTSRGDLAVAVSNNDGNTWTAPQPLDLPPDLFGDISRTEENTLVQLDSDRVLAICRVKGPGGRLQLILRRAGDRWKVESRRVTTLGYGGHPFARMATDGTIFYAGNEGIFASLDEGKSWSLVNSFRAYYPQLIEVDRGRIIALGHHGLGDTCWPTPYEANIHAASFSYRQIDTFEQTDSGAAPALAVLEDSCLSDFHARARIRVGERAGLAFRIQNDPAQGYYVAVLRLHDGPGRWATPKKYDRVKATLDIARIIDNKATILNRQYIGDYFCPGKEIEIQVRMKGVEIMASVIPHGPEWPRCVLAKDDQFSKGSVGLFTQLATAQFKHVTIWDSPRMVRHTWSNGGNASTQGFVPHGPE